VLNNIIHLSPTGGLSCATQTSLSTHSFTQERVRSRRTLRCVRWWFRCDPGAPFLNPGARNSGEVTSNVVTHDRRITLSPRPPVDCRDCEEAVRWWFRRCSDGSVLSPFKLHTPASVVNAHVTPAVARETNLLVSAARGSATPRATPPFAARLPLRLVSLHSPCRNVYFW
jgi:hypothetical protein